MSDLVLVLAAIWIFATAVAFFVTLIAIVWVVITDWKDDDR